MKYLFIEKQREKHPVRVLCEVLEVSESGYYEWRKRVTNQHHEQADKALAEQVATVFEQSRQTYGSPRVYAALRRSGVSWRGRRQARLMRQKGLVSCWRRKKRKVCTTDSQHNQPVAPNRLNRDFTATAPNHKWVGDITGVLPEEGWLYLSALVDVYSRTVVGWLWTWYAMSNWSKMLYGWPWCGAKAKLASCIILTGEVSIPAILTRPC